MSISSDFMLNTDKQMKQRVAENTNKAISSINEERNE